MKLVVGLGNPGRKYRDTRHNVGFHVVAAMARQQSAGPVRQKFHGEITEISHRGDRVLLLSPTTYMNRSGQSVRAACDYYRLTPADLLVVCDDFNLPLGRLRFRAAGSAGGQKGMVDIIQRMGSDQFARLRIGIGSPPPNWDVADFVLSRFRREERPEIDDALQRAHLGALDWITHGIAYCMNQYNG
jgi:PTH1 family peptidyl-tRNA hydrolase